MTTKDTGRVEHTPTPWSATTRQGSWDWVVYSVADPNIEICQPFHDGTEDNPTGEANAELIVRAVNAHEELTAVLRDILTNVSVGEELRCRGNAALVKAGDGRAR